MKQNLSDIFSGVNKELLNSTKDKFNKLSSIEKKKVLDSTNKLMETFCDICGVENKYHLTEEMFDDAKEKCKETAENIKDSIKYNVNVNLLFDSVIINVGGYYESCRS